MIKNVKIVMIWAFESKFYQYFVFTKAIPQRFVSFCIILIFKYYSFVEKMVKIKLFLLNFIGVKMCDKMAISAYVLKIVEKDPFLRL